jgi:hypothetical protein
LTGTGSSEDSAPAAASLDDQSDHPASNGSAADAGGSVAAAGTAAKTVNSEQTTGNTLNMIVSGRHVTRDCGDGKIVNINGYDNDIKLTGRCGAVALNGWGNHIYIEETPSIQVSGHTNAVTWERVSNGKQPSTSILNGNDNSIRQGDLPSR